MNCVPSENRYHHISDRPPTPSKTPTSATYDEPFFQSPKHELSFRDSAVTLPSPDSHVSGRIQLQTPNKPTRVKRTAINGKTSSSKRRIESQLASHVQHFPANQHLVLPPVEPSRQLSSSPGPPSVPTSRTPTNERTRTGTKAEYTESNSFIRTPPPTRTSKRQASDLLARRVSASTMAAPRRNSNPRVSNMGPPETPSRMMHASPQLFPALQFSPDLFQPHFSGPATAPIYPQQRLFWDPNSAISNDAPMAGHYQDPYGVAQTGLVSPFNPSPVMNHGFENNNMLAEGTYDLPSSQASQATVSASPYFDSSAFPAPFTASPRAPAAVAEDPGLFLSSPARRFGPPVQSFGSTNLSSRVERQPYHHQIEESKREEEFERSKKTQIQHHSRPVQTAYVHQRPVSPNVVFRPGLKRSSTHSGVGDKRNVRLSQQNQVSFADSVSATSGEPRRLSQAGRSSPLKRVLRDSWQSFSERPASRQRTSLTFTIDKDGRAKTLVTTVPETAANNMDSNGHSSDSDVDSVDAADFNIARSQSNSFAFPEQEMSFQPLNKHKSAVNSHSKNSSLSSTLTSSNSTYHSSRASSNFGSTRPRSKRTEDPRSKSGQGYSGHSRHVFANSDHGDKSFLDDASEDERGDAQYALRAVLKDRSRSTSQAGFVNRRSGPPPQFHSSPPMQQSAFGAFNLSPTTITDPDLATPSTDRESYASNNSTRCICSSSSPDGHYMIQCESCSKWLHTHCVGIDARQIPAVYICVYCAQTPMRHGRIREPSRAVALAPASPLAHKSHRYR